MKVSHIISKLVVSCTAFALFLIQSSDFFWYIVIAQNIKTKSVICQKQI